MSNLFYNALRVKKRIFLCLIIISISNVFAQEYKDKQNLTFKDSSKKTVILPEFLVQNSKTKEYEPFEIKYDNFYLKTNPLGIRYFNFGCIKTKKNGFWLGQIGKDSKGHAIFKKPIYGIRTMIILNTEIIEKRGKNTLLKFFNVYAPSTDCIGSVDKVLVNGKYICPNGNNDPKKYAKKVGDAIGLGINDIIPLRDSNGKLDVKLINLIINEVAFFETGKNCKFSEETVKKAIDLEINDAEIDNFIEMNLSKSISNKKYQVGKNSQYTCGYDKIYFVEGFNADSEIKERFMIYIKDGVFIKSYEFIKWCSIQVGYTNSPEFNNKIGQIEQDKAIENLNINYNEENLTEFDITYKTSTDETTIIRRVTFTNSNDNPSYGFPNKKECN